MADREAVDDSNGIIDGLIDLLWNRAENPNLTTSQKIQAVSPEAAERYRQERENGKAIQEIRQMLLEDRQKRGKVTDAAKRSTKQFLKLIGWLD